MTLVNFGLDSRPLSTQVAQGLALQGNTGRSPGPIRVLHTGYTQKMDCRFSMLEGCYENHTVRNGILQIAPAALRSSVSGFKSQIHRAQNSYQWPKLKVNLK